MKNRFLQADTPYFEAFYKSLNACFQIKNRVFFFVPAYRRMTSGEKNLVQATRTSFV